MKIRPKGRKHEDCEVCNSHPLFDLDEKVCVHGKYYTKEQILDALLTDSRKGKA